MAPLMKFRFQYLRKPILCREIYLMQLNVLVVGCQSSLLSSMCFTRTSPPYSTCTDGASSIGESVSGDPPKWEDLKP